MELILEQVSVTLNGGPLLRPFTLHIPPGDIVTLMGPSGSGKSSLLSYIGGDLMAPLVGSGRVLLDGRELTALAPEQRKMGRLFQDDLLFPHLMVGENLLFGVARGPREQREAMLRIALQRAELEGFESRAPHTLSAGQRSRIALFRALLAKPHAMLLDEPFAKFDAELRQAMRNYVFALLRERKIPSLLVSHDRSDAPAGGRILVITRDGEVRDA